MIEYLYALDWLGERITTTSGRLAVTIVVVGILLFLLLSYRAIREWVANRTRPLYADVVMTLVTVFATGTSIAVIVGLWDLSAELQEVITELDLGGAVVAKAAFTLVIILTTYVFGRFVRRVLADVLGSSGAVTDHQQEVNHRLSQVGIWTFSLVVVLGVWVEDLGGLLVGAGFVGIVVGLAARQTLGSVLAGFVLMFARPFEIGDWIHVADHEGIVTDISIVNTRVRSYDGEYVIIPNDVIGSKVVTNRSKLGRLRIEVEVGVDYESDLDQAAAVARATVSDLDESLSTPSPQVVAREFGDSAVLLGVRFWISEPTMGRRWEARTAAIYAIKSRFDAEGLDIPFPQRTVSDRDGNRPGGFDYDERSSGRIDPAHTNPDAGGEHD